MQSFTKIVSRDQTSSSALHSRLTLTPTETKHSFRGVGIGNRHEKPTAPPWDPKANPSQSHHGSDTWELKLHARLYCSFDCCWDDSHWTPSFCLGWSQVVLFWLEFVWQIPNGCAGLSFWGSFDKLHVYCFCHSSQE